MSISIQHLELGEVRGNVADGTAQFLGLKYASIQNRLATAELIGKNGTGFTNATIYGYTSMAIT
jgi:transcriptional regulator of acetoin/glycerol metabolism